MTTSKERIQGIAGEPSYSGAPPLGSSISAPTETNQDGVLRELGAHQIEKMTRDQVLGYQEKRAQQIEAKRAEKIEQDDFERYKEAFVEAGGREKDARGAWEAQKRLEATEAAQLATAEVLHASRRRVRHGL
jgi:hypothetical protein